ncbi:MAG: ribosome biogenesis protein tsr3 [Alyxoria varia]|nr:MAG: ribosome biogenesis protein tsr3 [Alyxoria varia]
MICGHTDWAEDILSTFSYGKAFLDINDALFKRYARCENEQEIKAAEQAWLQKIEDEYVQSRDPAGGGNTAQDHWGSGNMNRRLRRDADEDEYGNEEQEHTADEENDEDEASTEEEMDELPSISDDEEEMAELRRKVLQSRPFAEARNASETKGSPSLDSASRTSPGLREDSDAISGSDVDDAEFDKIINATPVTDRSGIAAKQKAKAQEKLTASFSRTVVQAPNKQ